MSHSYGRILVLALLATLGLRAKDSQAAPLKIHIISGAKEYQSEPSLKEFQKYLEKSYDITCTASWGKDGVKHLDNLDKLKDADVLLIFARRMSLPEEEMQLIRAHWEQGKPVIGIRTACHAFQQKDNEHFDRKVLGGHYKGHFGNEAVRVSAVEENGKHPVLEGVKSFTSSKLYKAGELPATTTVLQIGDIGKEKHPVTILNSYKGGRMFFTSLGVPEDFKNENFRRLLVNAIFWTTERKPPNGCDEEDATKEKALKHEVHNGYFVSNKAKLDGPSTYRLLKTQGDFDKLFGVAFVMGDTSNRLKKGAFESKMVLAMIHEGPNLYDFKVEKVASKGKTLTLTYTSVQKPGGGTAQYRVPLIVSVPRGDYEKIVFVENGKAVKELRGN